MDEQTNEGSPRKNRAFLQAKKDRGEPIVMLTCYDYPTAVAEQEAGVDVIFVGDSVGTNVLGYESETEVTMEDMVHHLQAVRRGVTHSYLLVDMPYRSFETPERAVRNARAFLAHGADGVKLEGGLDQVPIVRALVEAGIDVCGHIGFTPQTLGSKGRVQAKTFDAGRTLVESALALESAGVFLLVLELITEGAAGIITRTLHIPTIGIGSGPHCDGQVLVVTDVLGMSPFRRKISKAYEDYRSLTAQAVAAYRDDVRDGRFPTHDNAFPTEPGDMARLAQWLESTRIAESRPRI